MLIPESGASKVMKVEMSAPANSGVYRLSRREFEIHRTIDIMSIEITNSATKAIQGPPGPGTVTA